MRQPAEREGSLHPGHQLPHGCKGTGETAIGTNTVPHQGIDGYFDSRHARRLEDAGATLHWSTVQ